MDRNSREQDDIFMAAAMDEARKAAERDEVPIGAVLVDRHSGTIIARTSNRTIELSDPTAHAEILAIREGCRHAASQRIPECDLYVTLEPCAMCAAAISFARIGRVVFAAPDKKGGGVLHGGRFFEQPTCHHKPATANGPMAEDSAALLRDFFKITRTRDKNPPAR